MNNKLHKPWFARTPKITKDQKIAVLGGGIAGVFAAYHLIKHGFEVVIIEEKEKLLGAASGNPAAILDPYISLGESLEKEFYLKSYNYAVQSYRELGNSIFKQCGLRKISISKNEAEKFEKMIATYPEGMMEYNDGILTLPKSGYVQPHLIEEFMQSIIPCRLKTRISKVLFDKNHQWSLFNKQKECVLKTDVLILSNAHQATQFTHTENLPIEMMSGQISYLSPATTEENVLCSKGYLTPTISTGKGDVQICGATFDKGGATEISEVAHLENIENAPCPLSYPNIIGGRREIRAMTPDHLPMVGPIPNYAEYLDSYHDLKHGPSHREFPLAPYYPNLFSCVGLGSRGFLTAPLLGKYLTSLISGSKTPFNEKIEHALHPARFIIRGLSKK